MIKNIRKEEIYYIETYTSKEADVIYKAVQQLVDFPILKVQKQANRVKVYFASTVDQTTFENSLYETHCRNLLGELRLKLEYKFPEAKIVLREKPRNVKGIWFLDIMADKHLVVEWYPDHVGLSFVTEDTGYGEKPDNVYATDDISFIYDRIVELYETSNPPRV